MSFIIGDAVALANRPNRPIGHVVFVTQTGRIVVAYESGDEGVYVPSRLVLVDV